MPSKLVDFGSYTKNPSKIWLYIQKLKSIIQVSILQQKPLLYDSSQDDFKKTVNEGDKVYNITDNTSAKVISIKDNSTLVLSKNIMYEGAEYEINFEVSITGKAYLFQKGTKYLVKNLIISLSLAILLIAMLMAYMFRSVKMIFVSLIPNLLPLIVTAGLMGYLGVAIKPSTILIFSIAFGISVDDTIHFLAKYRQELIANNWEINKSVYNALRETGVSMFYTSIVLFFGFLLIYPFIAISISAIAYLLFAMLSNLLLLPSMLLSLEGSIANEKVLKEPLIKIIEDDYAVN